MKIKLLVFMFFISGLLSGQVSFNAKTSKKRLGINERLRIDFTMNKDGDEFEPPEFKNFSVVGGPSQSINNSWINGVRSFSKTYSYFLAPKKRGVFTIGQATIEIDGEVYKTLPVKISVSAAIEKPKDPNDPNYIASEKIHLVAEVSNSKPYLNEAITVVYKLYVAQGVGVRNSREIDKPRYSDFWSQNIDVEGLGAQQGSYKGEDYLYVVLKKTVLYPQKTGKLNIEPLSLDVTVEVPSNRRDVFGRSFTNTVNRRVSAGKRTINVKPLPEKGKPEGFSGAVGSFDFKLKTNKKELKTSEAFEVNLEVSGNGNLKLFKLPALILPSALEVYEPEHIEKVRTLVSGMRGRITDSYTVVPNDPGSYPIPSVSFSYFDLKSKRYKTLRSERLIITVNAGAEQSNRPEGKTNKNTNVADVKQFQPFRTTANFSPVKSKLFFRSFLFWVLLLGPFLLIPAFLFFIRSRKARALDVVGNKIRRTNRLARKYLSEAKNSLGQKDQFYNALERALHNYLKSKLRIETSDFSKDKVRELLNDKKIGLTDLEGFVSVLTSCEIARYTPLSSVDMENDFEKAAQVIIKLDKQLK
ncbi:BatD family protein [Flavobacteriaceae bacterium]|nr:BatD family protein [Flavobacteriaceae bacterium]MDC3350585.1 BatD family protein [Flavobacteriaceae bacterium]